MMILKNLRIWSREGFAGDCYLTVEGSRIPCHRPHVGMPDGRGEPGLPGLYRLSRFY